MNALYECKYCGVVYDPAKFPFCPVCRSVPHNPPAPPGPDPEIAALRKSMLEMYAAFLDLGLLLMSAVALGLSLPSGDSNPGDPGVGFDPEHHAGIDGQLQTDMRIAYHEKRDGDDQIYHLTKPPSFEIDCSIPRPDDFADCDSSGNGVPDWDGV